MSSNVFTSDFKDLAKKAGMQSAARLLEAAVDSDALLREKPFFGPAFGPASYSSSEAWQLPERQLLECVCEGRSVGGQSVLEYLLRANWQTGVFRAFVDAVQSLDPGSLAPGLERSLLWVQVQDLQQLIKALDLLLRDDNFALVAADLRGLPPRRVQSIPHFVWYRLQRLAHQRAGGFVVFTDQAMIRCADKRIVLSQTRSLDDLDLSRTQLLQDLQVAAPIHGRNQMPDRLAAQAV